MLHFFPLGWRLLASLLLMLSGLGLLPHTALAQALPTFDMAVRVLGPGPSGQRPFSGDVAVDAAGNSYTSGRFTTSVRFDNRTLTATSGSDVYVAKMDATGKPNWIVTIGAAIGSGGGPYGNNDTALAIDAGGNVCLAASFTSPTLTLGSTTLTNAGGSDLFVARLDANGNWLSAVRAGGAGDETLTGLVLDASNNAYLSGSFTGTALFGGTALASAGDRDFFAARLDANGTWRWAVRGGSTAFDAATDVALDAAGHAYLTGQVWGNAGQVGPFGLAQSAFVARLDAGTGTFQRVTAVAPGVSSSLTSGYFWGHLAVDAAGACYLTGSYLGTLTFGAFTVVNPGTTVSLNDVFVAKLDAAGTWQWASTAGGPYGTYCSGIAVDDRGGIYIAGTFRGPAQFGATALVSQNVSLLSEDVYVAKLDAAGRWLWAVPAGGPQSDANTGFALGPFATPYIVGEHFSPAANFGPLVVPGEVVFLGSTYLARMQPNRLRISGDSVLCIGSTAQLTASTLGTGISWRWSTGATTPTITVVQPGTYTATATFPGGYTLSETYRVRSIAAPTVAITGAAGFLCPGTPRQLLAVAPGAVGWRWSTGATTPGISVTQPGTYSVTATFASACTATAQAVVVANALRISGRVQLCPGQSTTLTAAGTGAAVAAYRWDTGATTPTLLVGQAGTFRVTATFADGCQLSATHTVGPPVAKVASVSGDTLLCPGAALTLTALNPDASTYRWNTGATTPTITVAQPGTYGVVLTYPGGCTSRDSLRVRAAPTIPAAATLGADTTLCLEQPLLLRAPLVTGPGVTLRWADGSRGPTLTVREPGTYSLQIRTPCDSLTLRRRVAYTSCLLIPNVITPNGDRQNDRFALQNLPRGDWALTLYNRWGRQVYHTNAYQQDWGPDAAAGTYYYLLRHTTDNATYKGWVEVVR
ncbi:T9SS type B sorting domain-containing protein [Hymenobacter convexus]|uniref:T9SS type B sorting domain-containing protein n=1 Tax=Hymenobacter sp. CA1UV-4 TaxID=3063782 RepID=UPI002712E1D1|nr:gliding motility-associated C-terminal domain-containing protein [Hymenobacter sp. CA1UV-4]MDO7850819.1 gliding motility-associated C-terminal domain-containing protein [Hymenobacter sp. CA1UV-4]